MPDDPDPMGIYRKMLTIRRFEEKAAEMYGQGKVAAFGPSYSGEEAVAVGAIGAIKEKDYVVSTYRQYGHCIANGAQPRVVMAELFGRETGLSHGRGGATNLYDLVLRFISGDLPIAVGLGLSIAYQEEREIVACLFGDDALARGAFHESLNMAALWNLPVIFICENNFYGMGTMAPNAVAQEHLYKLAEPYKIPGIRVDGTDVLEVDRAVTEAAARAREGDGPSLIEAVTYRFRGQSAEPREERVWAERDPLRNLRKELLSERGRDDAELAAIEAEVEAVIEDAVRFADESPESRIEDVGKHVYVVD
jgi:TPP-dependent pyruvate/acetoin dehydrogenase alpha subunit